METTREWWYEELPKYHPFISVTVVSEIEQIRDEQRRIQLPELISGFPCLVLTSEIELIAQGYLDQQIIPHSSANDALHIAAASYYKTDFLLTWNCHHLAEAHRRRHIRLFNTSAPVFMCRKQSLDGAFRLISCPSGNKLWGSVR